jgi:hypothetical protein
LDLHVGMGQEHGIGQTLGLMYGELNRQAFMLAFNDAFFLDAFFFVVPLFLVFFMRRAEPTTGPIDAH